MSTACVKLSFFYKKRFFYLVGSKKSSTFAAFLYSAEYAFVAVGTRLLRNCRGNSIEVNDF